MKVVKTDLERETDLFKATERAQQVAVLRGWIISDSSDSSQEVDASEMSSNIKAAMVRCHRLDKARRRRNRVRLKRVSAAVTQRAMLKIARTRSVGVALGRMFGWKVES